LPIPAEKYPVEQLLWENGETAELPDRILNTTFLFQTVQSKCIHIVNYRCMTLCIS